MAIRQVREVGDDILRKQSKPLARMTLRTKILIKDMLDTMYEANGVGLAAPQVTYLLHEMREAGFAVDTGAATVADAKREILKYFNRSAAGNISCKRMDGIL